MPRPIARSRPEIPPRGGEGPSPTGRTPIDAESLESARHPQAGRRRRPGAKLVKETLLVGRRPSCDICLDFERISGKHCELRFFHGLWHIRDIGSTNGTTVNGLKFATEQSVLPDVEIGIGGHLYTIDYEPAGPSSVVEGPSSSTTT